MDVKIEVATTDDLKDIQNLNLLLFKKEYEEFDKTLNCEWPMSENGKNYFKKSITEDSHCAFVARVDNKIVGYLVGRTHKDKVLHRILPLLASVQNTDGINFYRKNGFVDCNLILEADI